MEMLARYDHLNPQALRRLVAAGAQLRFWPRDIMQAAWTASHEVYAETSARNPRFKKIWESYQPYRNEAFQWFRVVENSFDNFAFPAAAQR
jgi:TRAP-type mannitol/chloroaromatic compound transport system substrate-binding protein